MRTRPFSSLLTIALVLASAALGRAAAPVFWVVATQADFLKGEVENLSIDSEGRVLLGPTIDAVADVAAPAVWCVTRSPRGGLLAGTGHEGRVHHIAADGRVTTLFDAAELEVHAVAAAADGTVYAATSPNGKIYRIGADGISATFFDPPDTYIWSLAIDPSGVVYAGTGDKGVVYRITPDGKGETAFATKSTNVVALTFDRDGRLLAGTESPGRVFRIDRAGKGFVLLDSPYKEIRALRVDEQGVVYAAALGARTEPERPAAAPSAEPVRSAAVPAVSTEIGAITIVDTGAATRQAGQARPEGAGAAKGAVYRIMPDGVWDVRWESADDQPFDMAPDASGALLIATGGSGKIFRVAGEPSTVTLVARAAAQQVTRFLAEPDGRLAFTTSNPGKVFRLSRDRAARGTYLSEVRDAQTIASWGSVRWRANGGRVEIFTRSGNTATPDDTWSEWAGPYARAEGEQIQNPKARYLQWRAVLIAPDRPDAPAPVLTSVTSAFLPRNLRPVVTSITVHPPGAVFQRPFPTSDQIEVAGLDATPVDGKPGQPPPAQGVSGGAPGAPPLGRRLYQKGFQTFTWNARDDNGDTLQFDVLYRQEGDAAWKALKRGLWDPIVVWDTTSVPDGAYTIKIVALDAPTNAPADALAGETESQSFDVDNTAPRIEVPPAGPGAAATAIVFRVRDDHSAVKRVEYSLDADRWRVVYPRDGIPDSRVEEFELTLEGNAAQKGVIIRATDAMNNVATAAIPARR